MAVVSFGSWMVVSFLCFCISLYFYIYLVLFNKIYIFNENVSYVLINISMKSLPDHVTNGLK